MRGLPAVHCGRDGGRTAGKGQLWRHDPSERPELFGDALVSCGGSLAIVDLPTPGAQLEFMEVDESAEEPVGLMGAMALF